MNLASRRCSTLLTYSTRYRIISHRKVVNSRQLSLLTHINNYNLNEYSQPPNKPGFLDADVTKLCRRFYADYPKHKIITLPNLSPTMETGKVISWGRKEGDTIAEGDLLAEIETDKATMSLDANDDGVMAKILVEAGTKDIPIGTPLCVIVENEASVAAFKDFVVGAGTSATPSQDSKPKVSPPPPQPPSQAAPTKVVASSPSPTASSSVGAPGDRLLVSPYARTLATERGINLTSLAGMGSGPDGRIRAADLDKAPSRTTSVSAASFVDTDVSSMRKVIAQRLTYSKQTIPHYYLTMDIRMDNVLALRAKINKKNESKKIASKLSVNDFIIKAAAVACLRVPETNSSWQDSFIRQYNQVDVSVAVSTPAGLITPIVFNANSKGLVEINSDVTTLAAKARDNKLQPQEFQGGTFTVSNLGMFGLTSFSAIVNPPQACILAVGGSQARLLPCDKVPGGFQRATFMTVTLCCDHRVVDGAVGARWLGEFKDNMEDPAHMLL